MKHPSDNPNPIKIELEKTIRNLNECHNQEQICQLIYESIEKIYGFSGISVYLLNNATNQLEYNYPDIVWPLPDDEKKWIIKRTQEKIIGNAFDDQYLGITFGDTDFFYVKNRKASIFSNKFQLIKDVQIENFDCPDALYWALISEEEIVLGVIVINNWKNKLLVSDNIFFMENIQEFRTFIKEAILKLDNLFINKKIESLLIDKQHMKERLRLEEVSLRSRILELSVLYDTSNAMSHSTNYYQITSLAQDAIQKVLNPDICSVLRIDSPTGSIFQRINSNIPEPLRLSAQANIFAVSNLFQKNKINRAFISFTTEETFPQDAPAQNKATIQSFINIPLMFKDEFQGLLNVISAKPNAFSKNEIIFLYTIANQLSTNIGRLTAVKSLEKSKISTMVTSMTEGVIMLDENNHIETINPAARKLLKLDLEAHISPDDLMIKLTELDLLDIYYNMAASGESVLNHEITYQDKILSANITPVHDLNENKPIGLVIVLRDITELQEANNIKNQRLNVISRVSSILNSITDIDNLLMVLMDFLLSIINAEMGSIQLKEGKNYLTRVHSNFPEKISREYQFANGEQLSEHVIQNQEIVFIEDFQNNETVSHHAKILIDYYLGIPIIVKNDLIGIVNIVKKKEDSTTTAEISFDDIQTLTTVTTLSGAAIYNAVLYQERLKKEKMEQELRVAHEIQNKLLPQSIPQFENGSLGVISQPAHTIGGDYYDFFTLNSGNIGIILADVIGKGVPAALLMVVLKSILTTNTSHTDSPLEAMKNINSILFKDVVFNKYVPVIYGILNPKTQSFKYCNAGHEPGIFYSNNTFQLIEACGMPLGAWEDAEYEEKEIILQNNDMIALFTDGVTEARNNAGADFGIDNLKKLIEKFHSLEASDIIKNIYSEIETYKGNAEQHDDLTLLILKIDTDQTKKEKEHRAKEIKELKVKSTKSQIALVRSELEKFAQKMGFPDHEVYNLKLVINEAQANIIEHAYHGNQDGDIIVKFLNYGDCIEIVLKDFGDGVETKTTKTEKHLDELEGSGLGVFLIHELMDKVTYKHTAKKGTELQLIKYLKKERLDGNHRKRAQK